jgi:hypothetical protein
MTQSGKKENKYSGKGNCYGNLCWLLMVAIIVKKRSANKMIIQKTNWLLILLCHKIK